MGVPSFYRWLSKKYPKIVRDVVEEKLPEIDGKRPPVDSSKPNPNGFEIDNLYLDMNGIIHPCCHPEDGDQPNSEADMMERIFLYIDRIFAMVRPRRVLYMGIDGVAPRAKMNQQRSRRFRAAKDVTDKECAEDELRKEWIDKGMQPPPKKERPWDSNVITPGTPFMATLSKALHWYILDRVSNDAGWRGIKVIFSDAKVPGEGEHKIMQFIRRQRAAPGYNPNTVHCLYGMDADLIMLGLATHEPNVCIFRETITDIKSQPQRCFLCGQPGHRQQDCSGIVEEEKAKALETQQQQPVEVHEHLGLMEKPFQFLMLNVLREYLAHDLFVPGLPFAWSLEHAIDDWVFLLFFVGNDFLPHLPALEIREGAIERLTAIYKRLLPSMGGYIASEGGVLNLSRIDILLADLGVVEDSIFKSRKGKEDFFKQRDAVRSAQLMSRRAQTLKARESSYALAEKEGFSAVKGGVNVHAKAQSAAERVQAHKDEVLQPGAVPTIADAAVKTEPETLTGHKRKVKREEGADSPTGSAKKKKKLQSGAAAAAKNGSESDSASSGDSDASDDDDEEDEDMPESATKAKGSRAAKKKKVRANDDESSSSSGSDAEDAVSDYEDELAEEKKSRKRKLKQKAKKAAAALKAKVAKQSQEQDAASAAAAAASPSVKVKSEPVDNLRLGSSASSAKALDAEAEKLDFGALLNDKLRKSQRKLAGEEEDAEDPNAPARDPVRFGEDGWKERYYAAKLHIERAKADDSVVFHKLFKSYAEGLAWVMAYYYSGCASWSWYYPFHYAPMASDLINLDRYRIEFEQGEPFKPVGQLMGVLPALSAHAVPAACQELMVNPMSPIIDFYPESFPLDLNGAKQLWRAVALLPWIEEKRLLSELHKVEPTFTPEERDRNSLGVDYLFVHRTHLLANSLYALSMTHPAETLQGKSDVELIAEGSKYRMPIDTVESGGMAGFIAPCPHAPEVGSTVPSEIGLDPVEDVQALMAIYVDPPHRPHKCELLPGAVPPPPVLVEADFAEENRGGQQQGGSYNSRNNRQRDAQRGPGNLTYGGGGQGIAQHGGQASAAQPRFGAAPSHFQQDAVGNRIWSSGYNQRESGGGGGRGGSMAGGRGGYQQQQQGGYGQQQQGYQQGGGYGNSGYSPRGGFQHQRGGYGGGRGGYSSPPPQMHQPYQHQPQAYSPQPPPPSGFSHSRGPASPPASNNPFAALQAQAANALQAHRQMQQQQQRRPL